MEAVGQQDNKMSNDQMKVRKMEDQMKRGRNYTISERAIMSIGTFAGLGLEDVNNLLLSEQRNYGRFKTERELNESSYEMLKDKYFESMLELTDDMSEEERQEQMDFAKRLFGRLFAHIVKPRKLNKLKDNQ